MSTSPLTSSSDSFDIVIGTSCYPRPYQAQFSELLLRYRLLVTAFIKYHSGPRLKTVQLAGELKNHTLMNLEFGEQSTFAPLTVLTSLTAREPFRFLIVLTPLK